MRKLAVLSAFLSLTVSFSDVDLEHCRRSLLWSSYVIIIVIRTTRAFIFVLHVVHRAVRALVMCTVTMANTVTWSLVMSV